MGITYFKSENVKVFPCAYRGQNGTTVFNPEARLNTEYNLTHTSTSFKDSYIVDWETPAVAATAKLCCVIGGYYFEITGATVDNLANKYLFISKFNTTFTGTTEKTWVLKALRSGSQYQNLDVKVAGEGATADYEFVGLGIAETLTDISDVANKYYLQVAETIGETKKVKYDEFLPKIFAGTGTSLIGNTQVSTSIHTYGNTASGANSAAFGVGNYADNDNSFVIGKYCGQPTQDALFIVGNGSTASAGTAFEVCEGGVYSNVYLQAEDIYTSKIGGALQGSTSANNPILTIAPRTTTDNAVLIYKYQRNADSTATNNGTLQVNGGIKVNGNYSSYLGGGLTIAGATTFKSTVNFDGDIYVHDSDLKIGPAVGTYTTILDSNGGATFDGDVIGNTFKTKSNHFYVYDTGSILLSEDGPESPKGHIELNYNYSTDTENLKMYGNFDSTSNYNPAVDLGITKSTDNYAYGYLKLWDGSGTQTEGATPSIELNGSTHTISLKAASAGAIYNSIKLDGSANKLTFNTSSALAAIAIDGNDGTIKLQKPDGQTVVQLDTTGAITGTTITGTTIKNSNNYYMPTVTKKITTNSSGSSSSTLLTQKAMKLVVWESKEDLSSGSDPHSEISYTTLGMTTVYAAVACSRNTGNVSGTTHKNSLTAFIDATNSKVIVYSDEAADKDGFYCIIIGY